MGRLVYHLVDVLVLVVAMAVGTLAFSSMWGGIGLTLVIVLYSFWCFTDGMNCAERAAQKGGE